MVYYPFISIIPKQAADNINNLQEYVLTYLIIIGSVYYQTYHFIGFLGKEFNEGS